MDSNQLEQSLLGSLICLGDMNGKVASSVLITVKPNAFNNAHHRNIYKCILAARRDNLYVEIMMLDVMLRNSGLSFEGAFSYLADLQRNNPSSANIKEYARLLREEAIKRFTLSKLSEAIAELSEASTEPLAQRIGMIQSALAEINNQSLNGSRGLRHISEISEDVINELDGIWSGSPEMRGYSTGFEQLDKLLGPKLIKRGSLVVIGSRPKMGKTAYLGQMVKSIAMKEKKRALIFSMEMADRDITERMVAEHASMSSNCLYDMENMNFDIDCAKFGASMQDLIKHEIYIDDTPSISIDYVERESRMANKESPVGIIAVDYLTLMDKPNAERNDLALGEITKRLKILAKELGCVVLLLTQLSRSLESRTDKRPMPSDSRDTGQIEQDCDVWIGLYREGVYNTNLSREDASLTELIVRLNRNGGTGTGYAELTNGYFRETQPREIGVTEKEGWR